MTPVDPARADGSERPQDAGGAAEATSGAAPGSAPDSGPDSSPDASQDRAEGTDLAKAPDTAPAPSTGSSPGAAPGTGPGATSVPGLLAELTAQEQALVLPRFTHDDAWRLGSLLVEMARERGAAVTVGIVRGGQRLFHCAMEGTTPDNDAWLERKARVVERYAASSLLAGERFRAKGSSFEESSRLDPDRYAAHGGAFPLRVTGVGVVGSVGVSGLPQAEDHALAVAGLSRFLEELRTSWTA